MRSQSYLLISSCLFTLVAIAHLARAIQGWPVQVAQWVIPMEVSWVGFAIPAVLAIWGFGLARRAGSSD